ncbi:uncharacterized protein [Rutidosis leptorrhynchoides]|uniref:uncharacterized protein isoform X2 n=1 Tax=Rutidosis leptorrhynchoides TaxID=125765 RepID=UPI003A9943AC
MVSGSRIEGGNNNTTHNLSAGVRKTIQSIKEIVGNHSDADIYITLKESNMDPNETTQKLLNQDPFHEVRRKKDKKKEALIQVTPLNAHVPAKPIKPIEQPVQVMKSNTYSDRNPRRANYVRNNAPDAGMARPFRQFRVVRDNRINQNGNRVIKPPAKNSVAVSTKETSVSNASEKSSAEASKDLKPLNLPTDSLSKQVKNVSLSGKKLVMSSSNVTPPVHATKTHDSVTSPNNSSSVVGVYSSSSDPVHIPSLASRPAANVGAIKREVGAVGVRRHTSDNTTAKLSSFPAVSKSDQPPQSNVSESVPSMPVARPLNNNNNNNNNNSNNNSNYNQHNSRPHQHPLNHQKVSQANKEWKPKSSKKPSVSEVGVIGTPKKPASTPANNSKDPATESAQLQDKVPHETSPEDQNVIIAPHIRVSETDRCRLTFGSLGINVETPKNSRYEEVRHIEEPLAEPLTSLSVSSPDSSSDEPSVSKQVESVDERVQSSGSISQESGTSSEQQSTDRLESSSPQNIENYTNIGLVRHSSPSQQQQGPSELPSFSAYDPQAGYDISYFRPGTDESLRAQVLQIPQEAFNSHLANSISTSTIPMVQQQQAQVAQMYPQVHLQHFIPYRQFIPPVYVPPMVMPGYSNNPTYSPHPTNGSSYLLVPGANSPHVNANGMKYAMPQYKSLQAGSPTGFGNFTSPTGYTLNTPGVVGNPSGLDDPSRLKYKDGNIYVTNPQAETSELWMNPRDMPSMQSASYYNMAGQTPHGAYMPSHTGHATFNAAAAAQSSHMQFSGLYHPSQPTAIANPHHMGPTMGGNVGVAPGAPGTQVGGYQQQQQQPQMSQMNWTGNF